MAETPKCTSIWGHKFEARYSFSAPAITKMGEVWDAEATVKVLNALSAKTYEHDICTRCGFVVERKTPAKATE